MKVNETLRGWWTDSGTANKHFVYQDDDDYTDGITEPSATNSVTVTGTITKTGSNSAHNNLQPYITCYMWKRTS